MSLGPENELFPHIEDVMARGVRAAGRALAHQINNPLAIAVGLIDNMLSGENLNTNQRQTLELVNDQLMSIHDSVNKIGNVRRIILEQTPVGESLNIEESIKPPEPLKPGHTELS